MQRHSINNTGTEVNKANALPDIEKKEIGGNYALDNRPETIAQRKILDTISTNNSPKVTVPKAVLKTMPAVGASTPLTENKLPTISTISAPIQRSGDPRKKNENEQNKQKDTNKTGSKPKKTDVPPDGEGAGGGAAAAPNTQVETGTGIDENPGGTSADASTDDNQKDTSEPNPIGTEVDQDPLGAGGGAAASVAAAAAAKAQREAAAAEEEQREAAAFIEKQRRISSEKENNNRKGTTKKGDSTQQTNNQLTPALQQQLSKVLSRYKKKTTLTINQANELAHAFLRVLNKISKSHGAHGTNFRQEQDLQAVVQNILNGIQDQNLKRELIDWLNSEHNLSLR